MEEIHAMSSSRPYLIRAIFDWIVDNGLTPYLLVDARMDGVAVPLEFVEEGKIVLNVSPSAVERLDMGNDRIRFQARFSGTPRQIDFPASAALAIYARENGQGMMFGDSDTESPENAVDSPLAAKPAKPAGRPHLKVVK